MGKKDDISLIGIKFKNNVNKRNVNRVFIASISICTYLILNLILINFIFLNSLTIRFDLDLAIVAVLYAISAAAAFIAGRLELPDFYPYVSWLFVGITLYAGTRIGILTAENDLGILTYYVMLLLISFVVVGNLRFYIAVFACEILALAIVVTGAAKAGHPLTFLDYDFIILMHSLSFLVSRDKWKYMREHVHLELRDEKNTQISEKDPLTGLVNRHGLNEATKKQFEQCKHDGSLVGVAILDIDHFKKYNDAFGHPRGDVCLKSVAKSVRYTVGNRGVVSRIGGEEFLIFMCGGNAAIMNAICEDVRKNVEEMAIPHAMGEGTVVTISVGLYAAVPTEKSTFAEYYTKADKQLYKSKENGRNQVNSNRKK